MEGLECRVSCRQIARPIDTRRHGHRRHRFRPLWLAVDGVLESDRQVDIKSPYSEAQRKSSLPLWSSPFRGLCNIGVKENVHYLSAEGRLNSRRTASIGEAHDTGYSNALC